MSAPLITPGRWFADGFTVYCEPPGHRRKIVAMAYPDTSVGSAESMARMLGNAMAMSAAPELLNAAGLALVLIEAIQEADGFSRATAIPATALRAAIAKATGK